jgi:hypothetical protein
MLQVSDLGWPKDVSARRKLPKLAIKRGTSKTTTKTEVTYTKGWSGGRKRAGERLKIVVKKASIAMAKKASTTINERGHKRKATEAVEHHRSQQSTTQTFLTASSALRL